MTRGVLLRTILGIGALGVVLLIYFAPQTAAFIFSIVAALLPLWLPVLLALAAWPLWLHAVRSLYTSSISYTTLELKPGPNTPKTAKPMELALYSLYYRTEISLKNSLLIGMVRLPWSFEVRAGSHTIRYYLHVPTHHRAMIESRLRAEYRDIDFDEVADYTHEQTYNPFTERISMFEFALEKPDPYPLVGYTALEHSKDRRDIFAELVEDLASVGNGEEVWMSLMLRPHQRDWGTSLRSYLKPPVDSLHEDAASEIQRIIGAAGDVRGLPAQKQRLVTAIEHGLQKPSFDCGLRVLYRAERDLWSDERVVQIKKLFDRFGDRELNSFICYDPFSRIGWPRKDLLLAAPFLAMNFFLRVFSRRAFFSPPYYGKSFILNTEELATLWHLIKPSRATLSGAAQTRRLEPPDSLPI